MNLGPSPGTDGTPTVANRLGMASLLLVMPRLTFFSLTGTFCLVPGIQEAKVGSALECKRTVLSSARVSMHRNGNRPWCILRSWRGAFGWGFEMISTCGLSCFYPGRCMEDRWVWAGCDHFQCCNLSVWKIRKMAICCSLTPVHAAETSIAERGKVLGWHSCGSFTIVFGIHETHARTIHIDGSYPSAGLATWWYIWKTYGP